MPTAVYLLWEDTSDFEDHETFHGVYATLALAKAALRKSTERDAIILPGRWMPHGMVFIAPAVWMGTHWRKRWTITRTKVITK